LPSYVDVVSRSLIVDMKSTNMFNRQITNDYVTLYETLKSGNANLEEIRRCGRTLLVAQLERMTETSQDPKKVILSSFVRYMKNCLFLLM
jgi:hypothetical protein